MTRILVFGNSGSGKTTLASRIAQSNNTPHLDLDNIAWKPNQPAIRASLRDSFQAIDTFTASNTTWVIEGCYSTLLEYAADNATEIIFLNPGVAVCQENCRTRPWEPHKYSSPEAQNQNLTMLLDWVAQYDTRDDEFSLQQHQMLYDTFDGPKTMLTTNAQLQAKAQAIAPL